MSDCSYKFVSLPVTETDEDMLYPIGIQNFEKIRKEGYAYVDKTALIHRLATTGTYYFLSRPRRFGKSMFTNMLDYYYSIDGMQQFEELFKDHDITLLADKSLTKEELLKVLEEFYPKEEQAKYGVLGIRIELL